MSVSPCGVSPDGLCFVNLLGMSASLTVMSNFGHMFPITFIPLFSDASIGYRAVAVAKEVGDIGLCCSTL